MHSYADDFVRISSAIQSSYEIISKDKNVNMEAFENLNEAKSDLHSALQHLLMQTRS